jgi:hypothetical protein
MEKTASKGSARAHTLLPPAMGKQPQTGLLMSPSVGPDGKSNAGVRSN